MFKNAMIDSHNHTRKYSMDGVQTLDQLVDDAIAIGLKGVVVTEHYDKDMVDGQVLQNISPFGGKPHPDEWVFDISAYFETMFAKQKDLQERHVDFELLTGIELGYLPHLSDDLDQLVNSYPFDCVIASIHTLNNKDIYDDKDLSARPKEQLYADYLEVMLDMLNRQKQFDVLAHYDFIARVADYTDNRFYYREFPDHFDEIFRSMIENDVSLELNTRSRYRSINGGDGDPGLPDSDLILRYLELGGEFITVSSDSHDSGDVGRLIEETSAWLNHLGVSRLTTFKNRRPVFMPIK
ncbi:MAG: histidinol-phosphatase HisJ family protein [Fastidiosipilaceae bacterium]|jgi:histidinol-phosphatase (PHP family)